MYGILLCFIDGYPIYIDAKIYYIVNFTLILLRVLSTFSFYLIWRYICRLCKLSVHILNIVICEKQILRKKKLTTAIGWSSWNILFPTILTMSVSLILIYVSIFHFFKQPIVNCKCEYFVNYCSIIFLIGLIFSFLYHHDWTFPLNFPHEKLHLNSITGRYNLWSTKKTSPHCSSTVAY